MANPEHLDILKQGVNAWNEWRSKNSVRPNLSDTHFSGEDFSNLNLSRADLSNANLRGVDLSNSNLSWANLRGANLTDVSLRGANLNRANLTGANFNKADLRGANLSWANLLNTDFSTAVMGWTVLGELDLSVAKGLTTVRHERPSTIGVDTLLRSKGNIPDVFLWGVGVPNDISELMPTLRGNPIEFYSCFISYSHVDESFARRLYDTLQGRGIRCWLDEHEVLPGQKIYVEVDRGIRIWDKILLCCSEHSLTSWWVNNEVELAIQKEQRLWEERGEEVLSLIPLNLDGYMFKPEWRSSWKGQITQRLAADFTGW